MQSNFRTLIFYIIILTLVFLPLKIVLAGQDDSGLKVVTIEGKDLVGEAINNLYYPSDDLYMDTVGNFLTDGFNAIPTNTENLPIQFEASNSFIFASKIDFSLNLGNKATTHEIYINGDTTKTCGDATLPGRWYFKNFFDYVSSLGDFYHYCVTPNYIYFYDSNEVYSSSMTNPARSYSGGLAPVPGDSDVWLGRLFIGYKQYLLYSSASDKTDFTVSSTAGGIIRTPDGSEIYYLYAHQQGLTVITNSGIWLLSGADTPESWNFQLMKNIYINFVIKSNLNFVLAFTTNWDCYVLDNININFIGNFKTIKKDNLNYWPLFFNVLNNKYIIISGLSYVNSKYGFDYSVIFDMENKKISRNNWITCYDDNLIYLPNRSGVLVDYLFKGGFYYPTFGYAFPYEYNGHITKERLSLDGNFAVRKNIVRVEIDIPFHPVSPYSTNSSFYISMDNTVKTFTLSDTETYPKTLVANMNVTGNAFKMEIKSESAFIRRIRIYYREIGNNKKDGTL